MSTTTRHHFLLVYPPVGSFTHPPFKMAQAASLLKSPGVTVQLYDANLDFFRNHLFARHRLQECFEKIQKRHQTGLYAGIDTDQRIVLVDIIEHPQKWHQLVQRAHKLPVQLQSNDFYQPEKLSTALRSIDQLFVLFSLAFYPSHISWRRFRHPSGLNDLENLINLPGHNPFWDLIENGLVPKIDKPPPDLLICLATNKDQHLSALTAAHVCQKHFPAIPFILVGNPSLIGKIDQDKKGRFVATGLEELVAIIAKLTGKRFDVKPALPDFSGLPLQDYLAPELILPFDFGPLCPSFPVSPSDRIDLLAKQARVYRNIGFICNHNDLKAGDAITFSEKMATGGHDFHVALPGALQIQNGSMPELTPSGLKLIKWYSPKGNSKAIAQLLLRFSKAGIWNHVVLPANRDNPLAADLIAFVSANPNIVHSSEGQRDDPLREEKTPSIEAKMPAAYRKLPDLPGGPLWKHLPDSVYLFLYLIKFGTKRINRWRLTENDLTYILGQELVYDFVKPDALSHNRMDEICYMVEAGGSVDTKWVRYNLERAYLIAYVTEADVIVANSSLKRPRPEYIKWVLSQSGFDLSGHLERGYTSVRPEYRGMGIGTKLLAGLTKRAKGLKIFSIIGEDNLATQKIARRNQTQRVARYHSQKTGKEMGIWMPAYVLSA